MRKYNKRQDKEKADKLIKIDNLACECIGALRQFCFCVCRPRQEENSVEKIKTPEKPS
jgi:hypothetical protein